MAASLASRYGQKIRSAKTDADREKQIQAAQATATAIAVAPRLRTRLIEPRSVIFGFQDHTYLIMEVGEGAQPAYSPASAVVKALARRILAGEVRGLTQEQLDLFWAVDVKQAELVERIRLALDALESEPSALTQAQLRETDRILGSALQSMGWAGVKGEE